MGLSRALFDSVINTGYKKGKNIYIMCIMLSPKSFWANNYFLRMDFLHSCDFYMLCSPSWDFSYQPACWFLASFQQIHIFLPAADGNTSFCLFWMWLLVLSHCWERQWTPNSHPSSSYQSLLSRYPLKYFFPRLTINQVSPHRETIYYLLSSLLPLSKYFSTWFFLLGGIRTVQLWWTDYRLVLWQVDIQ